MISGSTTWNAAIAAEQKQPLYVLELPSQSIYIGSFLPSLISSPPTTFLPYLQAPSGAGQTVTETEGQSSISQLDCEAVDLDGELLTLAANQALLGAPCTLKLGFPGMAYSEFVPLFAGLLTSVGRTADGVMKFTVQDTQKSLINVMWLNGGPSIPAIQPIGGATYNSGTTPVPSVAMPALELESYTGFQLAVIIGVVLQGTSVSVSAVTDQAGNTYVRMGAQDAGVLGTVRTELWACFPVTSQVLSNIVTVTLTGTTQCSVFEVIYENVLGVGISALNSGASGYPGVGLAFQQGSLEVACLGYASNYYPASPESDAISAQGGFQRQGSGPATSNVAGGLFDSYDVNIVAVIQNQQDPQSAVATRTWAAAGLVLAGQYGANPKSSVNPPPQYDNAFEDNGQQISDANKRYVYGHPLDILLCVLQNELGLGQNPTLGPAIIDQTDGSEGTETAVFGPNSSWQRYVPQNAATLINPNAFVDVPGILALRDGEFANERMEFVLTRAVTAKSWLEDQILKPLGLYFVHSSSGQLKLKSMTAPQTVSPALWQARNVYAASDTIMDPAGHLQLCTTAGTSGSSSPAFNDAGGTTADGTAVWADKGFGAQPVSSSQIIGIPEITRLPVINYITARSQVDNTERESAAREYGYDETFIQYKSVQQYQQQFTSSIESDGLRYGIGAQVRSFLTSDRTFQRHAFGTVSYEFTSFFSTLILELGDFILLTHPQLADFYSGVMGVSSALCEVYDRQPDYASGTMKYKVLDMRTFSLPAALSQTGAAVTVADNYAGAENRIW